MMRRMTLVVWILSLIFSGIIVQAQDAEVPPEEEALPIPEQIVEVRAEDGLTLDGSFYLLDPSRPTVILLHELYETRTMWDELLRPLLENGYNILAVDLRGYGQTRGAINWTQATNDVSTWFTWLRDVAGVRPDGIATMGSSMGANLAMLGCGSDEYCRTAIAVSPGRSYFGVYVGDAVQTRPMLAIYAERDRWPALGMPKMLEFAPETLVLHLYEGNRHGKYLIADEMETFVPLMLEWLAAHGN